MGCLYYKWNIVPSKYTWQAQPRFFFPSLSDKGHRMPHEGKPRWPRTLTNRDLLRGPETGRGDKEQWKNESDLGFIHTSHQNEEERELEKIHGVYLRNDSRRWSLKSIQETGLENGILWCHWDRDLCEDWGEKGLLHHGIEKMGDLSDRQGHSGGLIPYVLLRKSSCFLKVASATAKWQWQCHCVLSTVFPVWPMEVTMSPFSFPDLILPLSWRLHMSSPQTDYIIHWLISFSTSNTCFLCLSSP